MFYQDEQRERLRYSQTSDPGSLCVGDERSEDPRALPGIHFTLYFLCNPFSGAPCRDLILV